MLGLGFTLTAERAAEMIDVDQRNTEVLFPYVNGEDLNRRPDSSGSRWIINFFDWSLDRARAYLEPMRQIVERVKPDRELVTHSQHAHDHWWQYERTRPELYHSLQALDRGVAITLVSKVVIPVLVPTRQVFSHMLAVFVTDDLAMLALLSSAPHYRWAIRYSSTLETRIRYMPSDVFETLPLPTMTPAMRSAAESLHNERSALMLGRQLGLTKLYNQVHDPGINHASIQRIRELHRDIDVAVFDAYGWQDLDPQHGHYETRQGVRYTVAPSVQVEILDRLLKLNHERYADEVARGPLTVRL